MYYWRGRGEVDFVVEHEGEAVPVQVSWDEPKERHLKALDEFVTAESYAEGLTELPGSESDAM